MRWFYIDGVTVRNWQGFTIYLTTEDTWGVYTADEDWLGDYPSLREAKEAVQKYNYGNMEA